MVTDGFVFVQRLCCDVIRQLYPVWGVLTIGSQYAYTSNHIHVDVDVDVDHRMYSFQH